MMNSHGRGGLIVTAICTVVNKIIYSFSTEAYTAFLLAVISWECVRVDNKGVNVYLLVDAYFWMILSSGLKVTEAVK